MPSSRLGSLAAACLLVLVRSLDAADSPYTPVIAPASPEAARAIEGFRLPEGMTAELAAAEPRLANPVAFTVTASGDVYVCETFRQQMGVEDNRGHMDWLLQDLQLESIEERIAMFRRFKGDDVTAWATEHDRIRLLRDTDGDGVFDHDTVFADGFSNLEDGTGAGVLEHAGRVYYTCIPALWSLADTDGDGVADVRDPLHHGYGVRVAFRGHDLHGLVVGPDGRIYFSLGDRGFNVITREGKRLKRPDTGAVFRCFPDGSHLEVFAYGLRNPQELAFDDAGNLFTGDNNSDSGDQARWVYVVRDGDSGWRMHFQYLDDRGPWNRERIWYPWQADDETGAVQPASILPPIANLGNGPSGLVFYPGAGLPDRYRDHFFLADFRGTTSTSGIWSFAVEPRGGSFEIVDKHEFLWSILATDLDFAPDGSLLVSDWVNGWDGEGKGRLYRFRHPAADVAVSAETAVWLTRPLDGLTEAAVVDLLGHPDRRVRQRGQFELVDRGAGTTLLALASSDDETRAMHGLHGLWQLALQGADEAIAISGSFEELLRGGALSAELETQIMKILVDVWRHHGLASLPATLRTSLLTACTARLEGDHIRLAGFAADAAGVFGTAATASELLTFLDRLADPDPVVRHQAVTGLVMLGQRHPGLLASRRTHLGSPGRLGVTLAMRRLADPAIASMLADAEPRVVAEAARAINDVPIDAASDALADLLGQPGLEPVVLRRSLNAAYRRGQRFDAEAVASVAADPSVAEPIRVVAARMLRTWNATEQLDTVTGCWRPLPTREVEGLRAVLTPVLSRLVAGSESLREEALAIAVALEVRDLTPNLEVLFADPAAAESLRESAFRALVVLDEQPQNVIERGLGDASEAVRVAAIEALAATKPRAAMPYLEEQLVGNGATGMQHGLRLLATLATDPATQAEAERLVTAAFDRQHNGDFPDAAMLELLDAAAAVGTSAAAERTASFRASQQTRSDERGSPVDLWSECLTGGDADRGRAIFFGGSAASCRRCHQVDGVGGNVGPQLSGIAKERDRRELLEAIVAPSATIAKGFETVIVVTTDGRVVSGVLREETDTDLRLVTPDGAVITIPVDEIDERSNGQSGMPADLATNLSRREIRDLVAYLSTLVDPPPENH